MTELERIIAERDQLRAELERAQIQFGTCSVCGYIAWRERNAKTEDCQYCAVQAELERVRAQNAAIREALSRIPCPHYGPQISYGGTQQDPTPKPCRWCEVCRARELLKSDAGKDHVAKEKLGPIVEALERIQKRSALLKEQWLYDMANDALALARSLGLTATKPEPKTEAL
jgi:hypothetical protein